MNTESKPPLILRLLTWLCILLTAGLLYGKARLAIEDHYRISEQPDVGVGPIVLRDIWLTNRADIKEMGLGTRYYIVLDPCTNLNITGEFRFPASFRINPWVLTPPEGQTFSNCHFNINVDHSAYWMIRRGAMAIFVAHSTTNLNLLPKF